MRTTLFSVPAIMLLLTVILTATEPNAEHLNFLPLVYHEAEQTPAPTATPTMDARTPSPEDTATPAVTNGPTAIATSTGTATSTETATPTATGDVADTPTPTTSPTSTGSPTATATATGEATVTPTATPTETVGENIRCRDIDTFELCAWVSDAAPEQQSIVTVYGRLLDDGVGVPIQHMLSRWHFSDRISECDSGFTSTNGVAFCSRGIGNADIDFEVEIDVTLGGYTVTTSFTPVLGSMGQ